MRLRTAILLLVFAALVYVMIVRTPFGEAWYDKYSNMDEDSKLAQEYLLVEQYRMSGAFESIEVTDFRMVKDSYSGYKFNLNGRTVYADYAATLKLQNLDTAIVEKVFYKFKPYSLMESIESGKHGYFQKIKECSSVNEQMTYQKDYYKIYTYKNFSGEDIKYERDQYKLNLPYADDSWDHSDPKNSALSYVNFNNAMQYHVLEHFKKSGYKYTEILEIKELSMYGEGFPIFTKRNWEWIQEAKYSIKVRLNKGKNGTTAIVAVGNNSNDKVMSQFAIAEQWGPEAEKIYEKYYKYEKEYYPELGMHIYDNGRQYICFLKPYKYSIKESAVIIKLLGN